MSDEWIQGPLMRRRSFATLAGAAIATACLSRFQPRRDASTEITGSMTDHVRPMFGSLLEDKDAVRPDRLALYDATCQLLTIAGPIYARYSRPAPDIFAVDGVRALLARLTPGPRIIRGHTLLWHRLQPDWMTGLSSKRAGLQALRHHVSGMVRVLRGQVHQWDVVNEPLDESSTDPDRLRKGRWHQLLGRDYISSAIVAARQADPHVAVGINENGLDGDDDRGRERRRAMLALLTRLRSEGSAPDYVGIQAHLDPGQQYSSAGVGAFIRAVRDLGVDVHVTELDVTDASLPADIQTRDHAVADVYDRYLRVVADSGAVASISTWGLFDDTSWLQQQFPRSDGLPQRPLPFEASGSSKIAWDTIRRFVAIRSST